MTIIHGQWLIHLTSTVGPPHKRPMGQMKCLIGIDMTARFFPPRSRLRACTIFMFVLIEVSGNFEGQRLVRLLSIAVLSHQRACRLQG